MKRSLINKTILMIILAWGCLLAATGTATLTVVVGTSGIMNGDVQSSFENNLQIINNFVGNDNAIIQYQVPSNQAVHLSILDLEGKRVRDWVYGSRAAGHYSLSWDGKNNSGTRVGNGVYLISMQSAGQNLNRKISIVR